MHKLMTQQAYQAFMMEGTRTGKLATTRADGRPHVVPVWFVLEGDDLYFITGATSVKGKNIKRNGYVAISVDDQTPPYSFVLFEGEAHILAPTPEELLDWSTKIARRYVGDALAEETGKRNAVPGQLLVRVTPTKVIAVKDVAD